MKRSFLNLTILGLIALMCASCNKDVIDNPNEDNSKYYTVQLGWGGELDITYEPLTKASTDDLYGVQVYSTPDVEVEEKEEATWTPYAYGLFDDATSISINLMTGYKYKFEATMIRDGKTKLFWATLSQGGGMGIASPFSHIYTDTNNSSSTKISTQFTYSTTACLTYLSNGRSMMKNGSSYIIPNTDRYYGELASFIPSKDNNQANIKMKRVSFGAKFIAKGKLATSGKLEVQIEGAPKMELALTNSDNQISDIFTFTDVRAAWLDNNYKQTLDVNINWHRTDGTTFPLGTHEITYKRNATTVVKVEINDDGSNNGMSFEIDDSEMGTMPEDDELGTTIKNGEIVDTDITTFDETKCILYNANTYNLDDIQDDEEWISSHISSNAVGKVFEMKFKLSNIQEGTSNHTYIASTGNQVNDDRSQLTFSSSSINLFIGSANGENYSKTWSWNDLEASPTDLITLKLSAIDETITINGEELDCEGLTNMSWGYVFSAYGYEKDGNNVRRSCYHAPINSELYYVKMYDADGQLTYIGYAAKATNPRTSKEEYCWYSKTDSGEVYQFANNSDTEEPYGGTF